ncbi:MAG: HPr family phosphocarrier protein [Desulfovibrionaceae bacterium]
MEQSQDQQLNAIREVCVRNKMGLHARPAARLAQEAQKFAADISLATGEQVADCKSVLDILSLAAGRGCGLSLQASGVDAEEAVAHLADVLQDCLGED